MKDVNKYFSKDIDLNKNYSEIIQDVYQNMPHILHDSENFYKSSSQFKTSTLDVTDLTPISSAKHILASINNTRMALEEAYIQLKRKKIKYNKIKEKQDKSCGYKYEKYDLDLQEIENSINNIESNVRGALRKIHYLMLQYKNILNTIGKTHISEEDYEEDQNRYHIMTAFYQALCAARSRGGLIDEGNHIYLSQLGINGAMAQAEVTSLLSLEQKLIENGSAPTHEMVVNWLKECAKKYENCPVEYASLRGFNVLEEKSLVKLGELNNEVG